MRSITPDISLQSQSLLDSRMRDSQRLATVKTDESHLSEEEKTKYAQAARGFESIFVSMLFKQMRGKFFDGEKKKKKKKEREKIPGPPAVRSVFKKNFFEGRGNINNRIRA